MLPLPEDKKNPDPARVPLFSRRSLALCSLFLALGAGPAHATSLDELLDLSIEELSNYSLTTMSRKAQRVRDVAAAGYVISREDIARSGALNIPEALRLVPGMEVAQLSANRWAISARGLNERFSNKLLVLVDGRNSYSPIFSGALWEDQNLLMEDIERIEVIRGPGAALWGSNAVNGVINIITRHARDTEGRLLSTRVDNRGGGTLAGRIGKQIGPSEYLRAYALVESGAALPSVHDSAGDAAGWHARRAGFRFDGLIDGTTTMLAANVFANEAGDLWQVPMPAEQRNPHVRLTERSFGFDTVGRLNGRIAGTHDATVQAHVTHSRMRTGSLEAKRTEIGVDAQVQTVLGRHDMLWGLDYRWLDDRFDTEGLFEVAPASANYARVGAFVHDEIALIPDTLKWIVGAKIEREQRSGFNWQPNTRMIWTPNDAVAVWGAVSRAVRTLSRTETDMSFAIEGGRYDGVWVQPIIGNSGGALAPEKATTYELGFRHEPGPQLRYDLTVFRTRYHDMRTVHTDGYRCPPDMPAVPVSGAPAVPGCAPGTLTPYVILEAHLHNHSSLESTGFEAAIDWQVRPWWRMHLNYTNLRLEAPATDDPIARVERARILGNTPRYQVGFRSSMNLTDTHKFDIQARHVARLRHGPVPAYTAIDAAITMALTPSIDLSLIGKNLFDPRHPEFKNAIPDMPTQEVERSFHMRAVLRF